MLYGLNSYGGFGSAITLPSKAMTPSEVDGWLHRVANDVKNAVALVASLAPQINALVERAKAAGTATGAGQATVDAANEAIRIAGTIPKMLTTMNSALNAAVAAVNATTALAPAPPPTPEQIRKARF